MHPFETREEYLAHKLKIDLSVMKTVVRRNDIFHKINISKLAEMIDYLLGVGFKATDICSGCRIFYFSLETIMVSSNEQCEIFLYEDTVFSTIDSWRCIVFLGS